MKLKSLAILATSGLLVAALSYAVPALAEEAAGDQTVQGTATDNNSKGSDEQGNATTTDSDNKSSTDTGSSSSDEGSPDTATGDDDY